MKVNILSTSGLNLLAASVSTIQGKKSDTVYRKGEGIVIGERDKKFIAENIKKNTVTINRALGLIHLDCIVTATPMWFKRSGINYCFIKNNEDGTITAASSISYYRLAGLLFDVELRVMDKNVETKGKYLTEWQNFFESITDIPMYELLVSREDPIYNEIQKTY